MLIDGAENAPKVGAETVIGEAAAGAENVWGREISVFLSCKHAIHYHMIVQNMQKKKHIKNVDSSSLVHDYEHYAGKMRLIKYT